MSMVNRRVLKRLQRQAESMMTDTCTVSRLSAGVDEDGYDTTVETLVYSGRCKVRTYDPQTNEQVSAGSPTNTQRYIAHFPVGTQVRDGDIVRVAGRARPLYLRGSSDLTWQTSVRMQAEEVANSNA
ncbi:MAG: DUF6093 family protein [Actinomyces sp.]|nr:DUF6093 family protein [Actinomyces sp.]